MRLQFRWHPGSDILRVDAAAADRALAGFLVDVRDPAEVRRVRTGLEAAVRRGFMRADEDLAGQGYAVTMAGDDVTLTSLYDIVAPATYPAKDVLAALARPGVLARAAPVPVPLTGGWAPPCPDRPPMAPYFVR